MLAVCHYSHHPPAVAVERGRSRTVSPIALARKAERVSVGHPTTQRHAPAPQPAQVPHAESSAMAQIRERTHVAVRTTRATPAPASATPHSKVASTPSSTAHPAFSPRVPHHSSPTQHARLVRMFDDDDEENDTLPLPAQMHRAHASGDLHTARVLFLVLHRGLHLPALDAILSPDGASSKAVVDIAATLALDHPGVRTVNEDEFRSAGVGGALVLEEEISTRRNHPQETKERERQSARVTERERKERERREKDREVRERAERALRLQSEMQAAMERMRQQEHDASKAKPRSSRMSRRSSAMSSPSGSTSRPDPLRRVSHQEVQRSVRGQLFPPCVDDAPVACELLHTLLAPPSQSALTTPTQQHYSSQASSPRVISRSALFRQAVETPVIVSSYTTVSSATTDESEDASGLSRSNSWASTTSESTALTSVSGSPPKVALSSSPLAGSPPGLLGVLKRPVIRAMATEDTLRPSFFKSASSSTIVRKRSVLDYDLTARRVSIPLGSSPLVLEDGMDTKVRECESKRERKVSTASRAAVTAVSGIFKSYIRAVQAGVGLMGLIAASSEDRLPALTKGKACASKGLKTDGLRASVKDVKLFVSPSLSKPRRELNFPSEDNVPLQDVVRSSTPCCLAHSRSSSVDIYAACYEDDSYEADFQIAALQACSPLFSTPSASTSSSFGASAAQAAHERRSRERSPPPSWRIRPVANPTQLRMKALQNVMATKRCAIMRTSAYGTQYAVDVSNPSGTSFERVVVGIGAARCRERVIGVAFEGLGGSRLAFESSP